MTEICFNDLTALVGVATAAVVVDINGRVLDANESSTWYQLEAIVGGLESDSTGRVSTTTTAGISVIATVFDLEMEFYVCRKRGFRLRLEAALAASLLVLFDSTDSTTHQLELTECVYVYTGTTNDLIDFVDLTVHCLDMASEISMATVAVEVNGLVLDSVTPG